MDKPVDKQNSGSSTWMYGVVLVVSIAIFAAGVYLAVARQSWAILAAGCASLVAVLVSWPIASALSAAAADVARKQEQLHVMVSDRLQQLSVLMNVISEQQLISDRAKQVAYRDKDREALRRAIREDLARRDWEAALVLVNDMEKTFGYGQEAVRFREEINQHRQETVRKLIADTATVIDRYCRDEKWSEALREAERLIANFPDNEQVRQLPTEIENRRQLFKKHMQETYHEAVGRKDIDGAIAILKKLDPYLTRPEAEALAESVRGVFQEKVKQLGTQFTLAVQDRNWSEAIRIGETIVRDFPNSGIAREVREKMDVLRQRATEQQPAQSPTAPELARA